MSTSAGFEQLHPGVQRFLWEQGWASLTDVQEQAIAHLLVPETDLVISAPTGTGKTEAAYLPILTRILNEDARGIRALYIAPLKALINDQFERLQEMTDKLGLTVHRWHGDVAAGQKRKLVRKPEGILLITPESLEAIFINHGTSVAGMFEGLAFTLVDELHSFFGSERGRQLQSLLHRVDLATGRRVPRVGLSATLGDAGMAGEFLRPGMGASVAVVKGDAETTELRLRVHGYRQRPPLRSREDLRQAEKNGVEVPIEESVTGDYLDIGAHLFRVLRGQSNLIFANRRRDVELYADLLRRSSERERVPNEFWAHHGSLSRDLREDAERALKTQSVATAVCTSTLEMGIDIGSVESVAQVGCPPSVSAMRQRLGRSGRREGRPSVLRVYVSEPELTERSSVIDRLRPELVQAIAMVRLMVRDRYCEPPQLSGLHLSAMVQQLLSLIAQHGGITAPAGYRALCVEGPFEGLAATDFALFLRCLGGHELVEQAPDGKTLLLGRVGERLVNHYSFYAAFQSSEEYRLTTDGRTLGTLPIDFPLYEGAYLVFAGRRWRVVDVDQTRRVVDLEQSMAGRPPVFGGTGMARVSDEVRREMLRLYTDGSDVQFADRTGRELLAEGRREFGTLGLSGCDLVRDGSCTYLLCWAGDRVLDTLAVQLSALGVGGCRQGPAVWIDGVLPDAIADVAQQLAQQGPADALELAESVENKAVEKYDEYLPDELLARDYASRALDVGGAWRVWKQLSSGTGASTGLPSAARRLADNSN